MNSYFSIFHVVGELAEFKLLHEPNRRLLVDISPNPLGHNKESFQKYPNRTSFVIFDKNLIADFLAKAKVGIVVEVSGTFSQSNYIPHKTTYIDTIFTIEDFSIQKATSGKPSDISDMGASKTQRQMH